MVLGVGAAAGWNSCADVSEGYSPTTGVVAGYGPSVICVDMCLLTGGRAVVGCGICCVENVE